MDPLRLRSETFGFFTRADADEAGYDDRAVAQAVRCGLWHRFRRGYYTYADLWAAKDEVARHAVRSDAVLRSLGSRVALSHVSGAVAHGVAVWGVPLGRVHVTRLDGGAGRVEGDVVHHEGRCTETDVVEVGGRRVLAVDRCVIEAASRATSEVALTMCDSVLHRRLCDHDQLMARFSSMAHWPWTQHLHVVVRMADGRAESVGESRGRWLCWASGLPAPQLQYEVRDEHGALIATCDWAWEKHRLLGEFDGRVKYGRLLRPGQDPGEVVFAEKQREDLVREVSGCGMVRLIWSDYERPRLTAARIERLLRRTG